MNKFVTRQFGDNPDLQLHVNTTLHIIESVKDKFGNPLSFYNKFNHENGRFFASLHLLPGISWSGDDADELIHIISDSYNTTNLDKKLRVIDMIYSAEIIIHEEFVNINDNINISSKYPLLFIHIPKTAGQSVNEVLGIDNKRKGHRDLRELQYKVNPDMYKSYTKFGIIRNPFDRMVSLYSYRIRNEDNWGVCGFPKGSLKEANFEWWFWNYDVIIHMLTSPHLQSMSCYDCLIDDTGKLGVDYTLRFENLNQDWEDMFEVLDLKAPKLPKVNKSKHNHYSEYYKCNTGEVIKKYVHKMFYNDFKYFGYKLESLSE